MNIRNYSILLLLSTFVLHHGYSQKTQGYSERTITKIEKVIPQIPNYDLAVELDYVDQIELQYWNKNSIKLTAYIELVDGKGKSRNSDFKIDIHNNGKRHNIIAKLSNLTAKSIIQKSGADFKPDAHNKDDVLRIGTKMTIVLPEKMNVEFKNRIFMGTVKVDHNGGSLLLSSIGDIDLNLYENMKADLLLSSLYGQVLVDEHLNITGPDTSGENNSRFRVLTSQREGTRYKMNGGNGIQISLNTYGNIKIQSKKNI